MILFGTIVHTFTVLAGSAVGMIFKKNIPQRLNDTLMKGLGLCTVYLGISGAMKGENTLIIGATSEDALMYFFTDKNSNLIEIMDIRHKISLSIYLSVMLVGAGGILLSAAEKKRKALRMR